MPIPAAFNRTTRTFRESIGRMTPKQRLTSGVVAAVGASVLAVSVVPGSAHASDVANPSNPVMGVAMALGTHHSASTTAPASTSAASHAAPTDLGKRLLDANGQTTPHAHLPGGAAHRAAPRHHHVRHAHHAAVRRHLRVKTVSASSPAYANNLSGWIDHAMSIMHHRGIPGSYQGIQRNILRESSGNPHAINLWDVNAQHGVPSKGLLQVIPPTFSKYHVAGTSHNIYNPVANIAAACNYAAHRYGSMDNVNSAY